jgi:hypothetical protein
LLAQPHFVVDDVRAELDALIADRDPCGPAIRFVTCSGALPQNEQSIAQVYESAFDRVSQSARKFADAPSRMLLGHAQDRRLAGH